MLCEECDNEIHGHIGKECPKELGVDNIKHSQIAYLPASVNSRKYKDEEQIHRSDQPVSFPPIGAFHQRTVGFPPHIPEHDNLSRKQHDTEEAPHQPLILFVILHLNLPS